MIYSLYTLVDITETKQYRSKNDLERLQQQNFDTVLQTIGLSGNVYYAKPPSVIKASIFGNDSARCWYFEWTMEGEDIFFADGDPIYRLKENFNFVPFITGLTESVKLEQPIFKLGINIVLDYKQ